MIKIIAHKEDKRIDFNEVYRELKALMNEIGAEPELWLRGLSVVFVTRLSLSDSEIAEYQRTKKFASPCAKINATQKKITKERTY